MPPIMIMLGFPLELSTKSTAELPWYIAQLIEHWRAECCGFKSHPGQLFFSLSLEK